MKPHITISVILVALFYLDATAQLVDRATFEQHRAAAHAITSSQRKATSAPITLTQNPFEIESFVMSTGHSAAEVKVYFNTSVMSAYRNECCPRVGEFELSLPTGYSVVAVTRGDDLQYVLDGMTVWAEHGRNMLTEQAAPLIHLSFVAADITAIFQFPSHIHTYSHKQCCKVTDYWGIFTTFASIFRIVYDRGLFGTMRRSLIFIRL